ncbi:hypothetical protein [Streptomyces mirabilis]|uniref:hypothetical protein n=1 Tax=Streptomyces mirabilis TaxID=68239 RepID=UPI0034011599
MLADRAGDFPAPARPRKSGMCRSPEFESLRPGGHADGNVGEAAFGLSGDVILGDEFFEVCDVFLGQGKFVVQSGEVGVGSGTGECFGDPALDVRNS